VHVGIQDKGYGLILEGSKSDFAEVGPGDWLEATGTMAHRSGLPVVEVAKMTIVSTGAAPDPKNRPLDELLTFQYLGQIVLTEGRVLGTVETGQGAYLRIGELQNPLKIFLPGARFPELAVGDIVRITGLSYQECPNPPYDRQFGILIDDPKSVVRVSRGWPKELWPLQILSVVALSGGLVWWRLTRSSTSQRAVLRVMYDLGEEVLASGSAPQILARINAVVPGVLKVTGVRLYLHERGTNTLNAVVSAGGPAIATVPVDKPAGLVQTGAATAFLNRNLLAIPDTRRSPFAAGAEEAAMLPKSLLLVPMLAQGEAVGLIELRHDRKTRNFSPDEKAVAQHLANQVAVAIKLHQQRSVREQLSRSEKLAAVGRLISGVVNDLQTPLASILSMAESSLENHPGAPSHESLVIASEARRASAIVSRLVAFAQPQQVEAEPVELNSLLRNMIQFRDQDWKACGIQLRSSLKNTPLYVMGSPGQLEQVFLNLFVHAEQSLEGAAEKHILVRADVMAQRVFVEIGCNAPPAGEDVDNEASALGLDLCRSILAGHGGEIRLAGSTFEIELPHLETGQPLETPPPIEHKEPARHWTALLIEPEEWVERSLIEALGDRGYRVVPVHNSEEGLDLVGRLRFDVVLCSTRLRGLNWVEFFDRVRGRVVAFTLLAESFSHDLSLHFRGEGRYLLHKPIEQDQFALTMEAIEARLASFDGKTPELESY
ncbi:MAG: GAF domain-containing protein, partial [Bryobacteraceae bacterium]